MKAEATALVLVSTLVSAAWPDQAAAQPLGPQVRQEYLRHYNKGNALLYQGKFSQAIAEYKHAIRLAPKLPGAWRQLGLAHEALKDYRSALEAYEKYLELAGPAGRYSAKVEIRANACRKQLGLPPKVYRETGTVTRGTLVVRSNVEGALVLVDGVQRTTTRRGGEPVQVLVGEHTVTVTKPGYLPKSRKVTIYPNMETRVDFHLARDPNYRQPPRPSRRRVRKRACLRLQADAPGARLWIAGRGFLGPGRDGSYTLPPGTYEVEITAPDRIAWRGRVVLPKGRCLMLQVTLGRTSRRRRWNTWAWASLGSAAAAALAGAVFGFLEDDAYERVRDRDVSTRQDLEDWRHRGETYRAVSLSLYGLAGAALVTSAVFFILKRHVTSEGETRAAVLPLTGRGLLVTGEVSF